MAPQSRGKLYNARPRGRRRTPRNASRKSKTACLETWSPTAVIGPAGTGDAPTIAESPSARGSGARMGFLVAVAASKGRRPGHSAAAASYIVRSALSRRRAPAEALPPLRGEGAETPFRRRCTAAGSAARQRRGDAAPVRPREIGFADSRRRSRAKPAWGCIISIETKDTAHRIPHEIALGRRPRPITRRVVPMRSP